MRDIPEQAETKRNAPKPRLHLASLFITLQTDTLRLDSFVAFDGNVYVGATHDVDHQAHEQCPVQFSVCKKDRAAYARAVAAFNEIMDEHDQQEALKKAGRIARSRTPVAATHASAGENHAA